MLIKMLLCHARGNGNEAYNMHTLVYCTVHNTHDITSAWHVTIH